MEQPTQSPRPVLQVRACAKINLTLDVFPPRPDGYHPIRSVMQTIGLHDTVIVHTRNTRGISITVDGPEALGVPTDESNLAARAAAAVLGTIAGSWKGGIALAITKRIPSQAGLGGGSSDAAAALQATNVLTGGLLTPDTLHTLALSLGCDVPFFLTGGTCLVEGIGDQVTPLADLAPRTLVVLKPKAAVSTRHAYGLIDSSPGRTGGDESDKWMGAAAADRPDTVLANDFHSITLGAYPEIAQAADAMDKWLQQHGSSEHATLCGSGSCLFAFVADEKVGQQLAESLSVQGLGRAWVTHTVTRSI